MDSRRPRPSTGPSSNGGGKFLQGVWMSKCEGGRIERLTKWSDGQKDQRLGSLDKQEHSSMVKMNLMQLEVRDELAALKKSRRVPVAGQKPEHHETQSPEGERAKLQRGSLNKDLHQVGSTRDKVKYHERNSKFKHFGEHGLLPHDSGKPSEPIPRSHVAEQEHRILGGNGKPDDGKLRLKPLGHTPKVPKESSVSGKAKGKVQSVTNNTVMSEGGDGLVGKDTGTRRVKPTRKIGRVELNGDILQTIGGE